MHWDRLFEDLESQLSSEWEAERAMLDAESERLRISRLDLRARLRALCGSSAVVTLDLTGSRRTRVTLRVLGRDWVAADDADADVTARVRSALIVPLHAIDGIAADHGMVLASLDDDAERVPPLRERMSLGFVFRDLARRRVPVRLATSGGDDLHGTIDRAGADHLDLAMHDAGEARRASAVRGFRIVPFAALTWVRTAGDQVP